MSHDDKCSRLRRALTGYRRKRISLEELISDCSDTSDPEEQITKLEKEGVLVPIKSSGTNGNLSQPLYQRYTICISKNVPISTDVIYALHPRLTANGYLLKYPEQFVKNRTFLLKLSQWLISRNTGEMMSRRERSFEIFGMEKELDDHLKLLESMGLSGTELSFYETPEQCFSDYIPVCKPEMTLLICENKDIWFNIRRLMYEDKANIFFDTPIDGVIYGQGNDITGKGKFRSYIKYLGGKNLRFLYCGDIDRAGFDIFLRLCKEAFDAEISLFVPVYRKMLGLSRDMTLPQSGDSRCIMPDMTCILPLFSSEEQEQITAILQGNQRLPQEIISYPVLADNMR